MGREGSAQGMLFSASIPKKQVSRDFLFARDNDNGGKRFRDEPEDDYFVVNELSAGAATQPCRR